MGTHDEVSAGELVTAMYPPEMIGELMGTDPQAALDAHARQCPMHEQAPAGTPC